MKKIILSLLFISSLSFAQTGINYQGAATDADGAKLVNQNISLKTSVLQGGVDGTISYSETHNTTTDQFGLFNVVIGLGNIIEGSFDSIQWGADSHFLKVELDATGGSEYSLVSTTQMMSVPYAKYAENAAIDSTTLIDFIANTGIGGVSKSLIYPEGFKNDFITLSIQNSNPYVVPENKNLYITNAYSAWGSPMLLIDNKIVSRGDVNYNNTKFGNPIIIGSGSVIDLSSEDESVLDILEITIQGFLTDSDSSVTPITLSLDEGNYIVPSNKTLFILNYYSGSGDPSLKINEKIIVRGDNNSFGYRGFMNPIVAKENEILSVSWGGSSIYDLTINGYLVDEDYFENYGGGGGSVSSSNSGVDSAMVADMISSIDNYGENNLKDLKFPEGINSNFTEINIQNNNTNILEGKRMYVTSISGGYLGINFEQFYRYLDYPLIINDNDNLSPHSSNTIIRGFYVDNQNSSVYGVNHRFNQGQLEYNVPENKLLVITNFRNGPIFINGIEYNEQTPYVIKSSDQFSAESDNTHFSGYLVDENYFENSNTNSLVNDESDIQITISTLGDSLSIGSQTFIIPGISVANYGYSTSGDIPTVYNPITGRVWMDRNLGASRVALSYDDTEAYGDLYQWGREQDGHEMRTSGITNNLIEDDVTQHNEFIINSTYPGDWRTPQNANLWQGVNGIDNPCPNGFRLPTKDEWLVEIQSWNSADKDGAFSSVLKLTTGGYRHGFDGVIYNNWFNGGSAQGPFGYYWSSTIEDHKSSHMYFGENNANTNPSYRAWGHSVRCILDQQ